MSKKGPSSKLNLNFRLPPFGGLPERNSGSAKGIPKGLEIEVCSGGYVPVRKSYAWPLILGLFDFFSKRGSKSFYALTFYSLI